MATAINTAPSTKKISLGAFSVSLVVHVGLLLMISSVVIYQKAVPKVPFVGESMESSVAIEDAPPDILEEPAGPPSPDVDAGPPTPSTASTLPSVSAPTDYMNNVIQSAAPSVNFSIPTVGSSTMSSLGAVGGVGKGTGGGGSGVSNKVSFFGLQSEAERIGFYLDFSGTMEGERRTKLIAEMEKTLQELPDGTEILIILWAGPAWNLGDSPKEAEAKWKKTHALVWEPQSMGKLKKPSYFKLDAATRKNILKELNTVPQLPGGTDWSSPFLYASQISPLPDLIFLMTDGQHTMPDDMNTKKYLDHFQSEIKKNVRLNGAKPAQINVVAIGAAGADLKVLQNLAKEYGGKTAQVK
jgi:hypothetical protein